MTAPRWGCSDIAHTRLGFCAHCPGRTAADEVMGWRTRELRQQTGRAKPLTRHDPRHGTENAYTGHGCRCADCREAHRRHRADQRAREAAR